MADGPFLCYRELLSSTSIVRSTFFFCYNSITQQNDEYLCTLLASGISIYKVSRPAHDTGGEAFLSLKLNEKLFGKPIDVKVFSYDRNIEDLLIISLDSGKLVMVKYVWDRNVLEIVLMCNGEENAFGTGSEVQVQSNGIRRYLGVGNDCSICLCSDNGVVASTIYGQYLVITPVPQLDTDPLKTSLSASESAAQSFAVDIATTLGLTGPIVDATFISGYSRPVLVILQQTGLLPVGHAAKVRHCCTITALAVNIEPKTLSVLWQRTHLPHDSLRLVPLSHTAFAGAVGVVSLSAVFLVNQEEAQGVATNGFAATTVDTVESHYRTGGGGSVGVKSGGIGLQSWVSQEEGIELDGSYWVEDSASSGSSSTGNATTLIGCLKDGTVLRVGMVLSTQRMLSSMLFTPEVVASTVRASCFCTSRRGDLWFLGSRQSSALLLGVARLPQPVGRERSSNNSGGGAVSSFLSPSSKRPRASSIVSNDNLAPNTASNGAITANTSSGRLISTVSVGSLQDESLYDEEYELYGNTLDCAEDTGSAALHGRAHAAGVFVREHAMSGVQLRFEIHDSLAVLGPMLHGLCTKQDGLFEQGDAVNWQHLEDKPSSNTTTSTSVAASSAASYIAERDSRDSLLFASGLDQDGALLKVYNGLHMAKVADKSMSGANRVHTLHVTSEAGRSEYEVVLISYANKTRVLHCGEQTASASSNSAQGELKFSELNPDEAGFICTAPTINVGFISTADKIIVQVLPQGLRVARVGGVYGSECDALQDANVAESLEFGGLGGDADEVVVMGDVCEGYVVLLTSKQKCYVLKYDAAEESVELVDTYLIGGGAVDGSMEVVGESSSGGQRTSEVASASLYFGVFDTVTTNSSNTTNISNTAASVVTPTTPTAHTTSSVITPDNTEKDAAEEMEAAKNAKLQRVLEEIYLYGQPLPSEDTAAAEDSNTAAPSSEIDTADAAITTVDNVEIYTKTNPASSADLAPQAYLVVSHVDGVVLVVRLQTMQCVVRTGAFTLLSESVNVTIDINTTNPTTDANTTAHAAEDANNNLIVETKLTRVHNDQYDTHDLSRSTLILTFLLSSGDLVVYSACEVNSQVAAFHKIDQCPVVNKRSEANKVVRSVSGDGTVGIENNTSSSDTTSAHLAYLSSAEYTTRGGPTLTTLHTPTRSGVLVSGNDAILVTTVHALPTIVSLALPEVPYINYGHCTVVPLTLHCVNGVATLWYECEDLEQLKNPLAAGGARASHLSIYAQVPNLDLFPGSSVSVKRVTVGRTVHRISEILSKTDDRTQLALLEKKTLLLACSEEVRTPFLPSVLTEAELQEDSELYERYFTSLDSFCQPDYSVGQAPLLSQRQHTLALLQNTTVVDSYALPINECVLDTAVLYFNVEKYVTLPGALMALRTTEKRVFLAACTALVEKRGEDTQGNGRLLLFALDYKLFEGDEEEEGGAGDDAASSTDAATNGAATTAATSASVNTTAATATTSNASTTAAQAKFLSSIKPKLRLLWSGPGPASVVKQLGDYVLSTVASTVYIYKFNSDSLELEQVSFFFAQLYISTVSILKNFILLGDMHHSVQLLLWREQDHSLNLVSKDFEGAVALSSEYIYDGAKLGMVMGDDEGNLQIFQEAPRKIESMQGTRLLCLADFHLGSDASVLLRHDLLSTDPVTKAMPNPLDLRPPPPPPRTRKGSNFPLQKYSTRFNKSTVPAKATLLVGSMDGGIGVLQPVEERMYKRLALMQQIMTMTVPTQLSLNPREYRLHKSARVHLVRKKGVLDGCMLSKFNSLPPSLQDQLAATVGATSYLIKENLHELDYLCRYF